MKFVIGTRGSKLALAQVDLVIRLLSEKSPDLSFDRKIIKTTGDKILDAPLAKIGGKGIFVKEIDEALIRGDVDFAVHSMKDVPTEMPPELEITSVPPRGNIVDALISKNDEKLDELPDGAVIGSSSLRRKAELLNYRPDLKIKDLRGNVDTRLRKLDAGEYDAIVMSSTGLKRLGFDNRITEELPLDLFPPAVGQGAVAVTARKDFHSSRYLKAINHPESMVRIIAERALLGSLGGGCQVPIGAVTTVDNKLRLRGVIISPSGEKRIEAVHEGGLGSADEIGVTVAKRLLKEGADKILSEVYGTTWISKSLP